MVQFSTGFLSKAVSQGIAGTERTRQDGILPSVRWTHNANPEFPVQRTVSRRLARRVRSVPDTYVSGRLWITFLLAAACLFSAFAGRADGLNDAPEGERDVPSLFGAEMEQAAVKLNWHGERLTEDTVYAAALTGLSWQSAWGRDRLFSLAWGECGRIAPAHKRSFAATSALIEAVTKRAAEHDDTGAVKLAVNNFSPEEIAVHPELKAAVGSSYLRLNKPQAALAVYAAPFDPGRAAPAEIRERDRQFREAALAAAEQASRTANGNTDDYRRTAAAFALSLLLEPETPSRALNTNALHTLEESGVDIERVLLGILQAPEHLRGLTAYTYAAADLLVYRASPSLLPFLMHLAQSDDVYLRGRAVMGLGIVAYQERKADSAGWQPRLVSQPLREYGLSVGERKLIAREIKEAYDSDKYRLRAAAAFALAMTGEEANFALLQKFSQDRAYLISPESKERGGKNAVRQIVFPVRTVAAAAMARYGFRVSAGGGEFAGKELERAKRGGQDVTADRRNLRRDAAGQIVVTPIDGEFPLPFDHYAER